jgi:hypothetical protein
VKWKEHDLNYPKDKNNKKVSSGTAVPIISSSVQFQKCWILKHLFLLFYVEPLSVETTLIILTFFSYEDYKVEIVTIYSDMNNELM